MSATVTPDIPAESAVAPKPRLKRLRLAAILLAVALLGLVSFVFGLFVSVASDLPSLERFSQIKGAQSSQLLDDLGHPIGVLSQQNRVILSPGQIPQMVKEAVISIEDKRFYTNSGVDVRGIARAFVQDILHKGSVQGASTIEQQLIKNFLQAQSHRTIFEKLKEAALAYQLAHKWSKDKIVTAYLNTIYFGNGAYGIEAAAQSYFGHDAGHEGCGMPGHELCVQQLQPWEAALLAGIIQNPTAWDPTTHPTAALERRNTVLLQMYEQGYLSRPVYEESVKQPLPSAHEIQAPEVPTVEGVDTGYFDSWVGQQVLERFGAARVRGRTEDPHHARPRHAARRRTGRQQLPRLPGRADRLARRDRKLHRRGPGDGRRAELQRKRVQHRDRGGAPAGIVVQGLRSCRRAGARDLAGLRVDLQGEDVHRAKHQRHRKVRRPQRRRRLLGIEHAHRAPRPSRTTRSTPKSGSKSAPARSPCSRTGWGSPPRSRPTRR